MGDEFLCKIFGDVVVDEDVLCGYVDLFGMVVVVFDDWFDYFVEIGVVVDDGWCGVVMF